MRRPRRNHSATFKAKVALAVAMGDHTLAQLAERLDVRPNQITQWKTELLQRAAEAFATAAETREAGPDIKALHARIDPWASKFLQQQTHFFGACLVSSAVDDSLPACPDIGIDFDSCSLDIFSPGLVAALSLAVSAGFVAVTVDGSVGIAGGMLATGGGGALETGGETLVCGGGDGLSPQATSAAAAAIAISR